MTAVHELFTMVNLVTDTSAVLETEKKLGGLIAARVAELRRREGLSLDRLAERSGLSKGTVVGIENERANPSIAILCRLAAALSVSVADLVGEPDGAETSRPAEQTTPKRLWESPVGGKAVLHAATSGQTMFELWSWTLGPGEHFSSDAHSPGTAELITVQSGRLEITVGSDSVKLKAGESARLRTDQAHSYRSNGKASVNFTMAVLERAMGKSDTIR